MSASLPRTQWLRHTDSSITHYPLPHQTKALIASHTCCCRAGRAREHPGQRRADLYCSSERQDTCVETEVERAGKTQ
jgi:hypothetical protein